MYNYIYAKQLLEVDVNQPNNLFKKYICSARCANDPNMKEGVSQFKTEWSPLLSPLSIKEKEDNVSAWSDMSVILLRKHNKNPTKSVDLVKSEHLVECNLFSP